MVAPGRPVRLGADYFASPLRLPTDRGWASVPLDRFDLSPGLRRRLADWASAFDALMKTNYAWPSPRARDDWLRECEALLEELRAQLGPAYDVDLLGDPSGEGVT